jgi:hypothetical protein
MFWPHRTIFRHILKESTALCTLSIVLLKYVVVVVVVVVAVEKIGITPEFLVITMMYFKNTIDKVHRAVDFLKMCCLKMVLCG